MVLYSMTFIIYQNWVLYDIWGKICFTLLQCIKDTKIFRALSHGDPWADPLINQGQRGRMSVFWYTHPFSLCPADMGRPRIAPWVTRCKRTLFTSPTSDFSYLGQEKQERMQSFFIFHSRPEWTQRWVGVIGHKSPYIHLSIKLHRASNHVHLKNW